ncbi:YicC/YloC family endoribonuclease [Parvularcula marina]|uniref:YicC/YloC family endoribonuclease n=1 Tax=Parvularcula marina TaxID=2292771 RepID=UPI003516010A
MTTSMTGFGAAEGAVPLSDGKTAGWRWELKGVNGKSLDVKMRMPSGLETIEPTFRAMITTSVGRGTIHTSLQLDRAQDEAQLVVDETALGTVLNAINQISDKIPCDPPRPDTILGLKGILTAAEKTQSDQDKAALEAGLLAGLSDAIEAFSLSRNAEGSQLAAVLDDQLAKMTALTEKAKSLAGTALTHHLEQIRGKIRDLIGDVIPDERTEQEAVMMAVKSDIREELDRLDGHLAQVREYLSAGGVIGRQLDFLAQELGREVNTLTSKAWTLEIKRIGLDLKLLVDQFREQVQNIE